MRIAVVLLVCVLLFGCSPKNVDMYPPSLLTPEEEDFFEIMSADIPKALIVFQQPEDDWHSIVYAARNGTVKAIARIPHRRGGWDEPPIVVPKASIVQNGDAVYLAGLAHDDGVFHFSKNSLDNVYTSRTSWEIRTPRSNTITPRRKVNAHQASIMYNLSLWSYDDTDTLVDDELFFAKDGYIMAIDFSPDSAVNDTNAVRVERIAPMPPIKYTPIPHYRTQNTVVFKDFMVNTKTGRVFTYQEVFYDDWKRNHVSGVQIEVYNPDWAEEVTPLNSTP